MTNSGGGVIIVGLADDGSPSGMDVTPMLAVDPADFTNKIYSYTDQHFADIEIVEMKRAGETVAVLQVGPSRIPMVFTETGGYQSASGKMKSAFAKCAIYFRHGARSEPGTTEDLRMAIERELSRVKNFWLGGSGRQALPVSPERAGQETC